MLFRFKNFSIKENILSNYKGIETSNMVDPIIAYEVGEKNQELELNDYQDLIFEENNHKNIKIKKRLIKKKLSSKQQAQNANKMNEMKHQ